MRQAQILNNTLNNASKGALGALDKLGNFAKVPAVIGAAEGGGAIAETYDKAIAAGGTHHWC